jgi:hypothetical protein
MLSTKEKRPSIRTLRRWSVGVLQEAGAIRECQDHGWMQDRAGPHAREHAIDIARSHPPPGLPAEAAVAEVREVLDSIGDSCRNARLSDGGPERYFLLLYLAAGLADVLDGLLHCGRGPACLLGACTSSKVGFEKFGLPD